MSEGLNADWTRLEGALLRPKREESVMDDEGTPAPLERVTHTMGMMSKPSEARVCDDDDGIQGLFGGPDGGWLHTGCSTWTDASGLNNLVFLAAPIVLRLPLSAFLMAWICAIPVGFLLDPVFHGLGSALLSSEFLTPLWIQAANAPLVPFARFNNTVTLGSFVFWAAATIPLFFLSRRGVATYRGSLERLLAGVPLVGAIGRVGIVRRLLGLEASHLGWIRKGFVFPLALFVSLGMGAWWLFADRGIRAGVERAGTRIVGATVDVGTMDVDLSDGILAMTGLQVTHPSAPENNIVEIGGIAAAMSAGPLLRAKVAIDSVVVRDIRFNSRRETPGEVDTLRERSKVFRDEMARWRASTRIPTIPTVSLSSAVDFSSLSPDSLVTVIRARELAGTVGVTRGAFRDRVEALDAGAQIDSASALLTSLRGASIRSLGLTGTTRAVSALRSTAAGITDIVPRVAELEENLAAEVAGLRQGLAALDDLRDSDYRRALGVLNLPSFDPDDISAALLQAPLMERVKASCTGHGSSIPISPTEAGRSASRGPSGSAVPERTWRFHPWTPRYPHLP